MPNLEIPGRGRVALMVYRSGGRTYVQPEGFSEAGIKLHSNTELRRLWKAIVQLIERREWTDDYVARTRKSAADAGLPGQAQLTP